MKPIRFFFFMVLTCSVTLAAISGISPCSFADEIISQTPTEVIVREHPQTGKPFVSVIDQGKGSEVRPWRAVSKKYSRPDYKMLNHRIKKGEYSYDGPVSDRKKVYILAASLTAVGVTAAVVGPAIAPAAASTGGASGGAGAFAAGGATVLSGTAGAVSYKSRPDPERDFFSQTSESKAIEDVNEERK